MAESKRVSSPDMDCGVREWTGFDEIVLFGSITVNLLGYHS
jgi:hypothetical protein